MLKNGLSSVIHKKYYKNRKLIEKQAIQMPAYNLFKIVND